jgi:hypothetical protein
LPGDGADYLNVTSSRVEGAVETSRTRYGTCNVTGITRDKVDLFEMANLSPALTGLPMVVWVSERGRARHDVRIEVHMAHGRQMSIGNTATVAVRPTPRLIAGQLSAADVQAVSEWIRLNEAALVDYWDGRIYTDELIQRLQRLP